MIIARLTVQTDPDGRKYLTGKTTSSWPLKIGTAVVLRKSGPDEYELLELGTRERPAKLDPVQLNSFLPPSENAVDKCTPDG